MTASKSYVIQPPSRSFPVGYSHDRETKGHALPSGKIYPAVQNFDETEEQILADITRLRQVYPPWAGCPARKRGVLHYSVRIQTFAVSGATIMSALLKTGLRFRKNQS